MSPSIRDLALAARASLRPLAASSGEQRNVFLHALARSLREGMDGILAANRLDLGAAEAEGLGTAMLDRLRLDPPRIEAMAKDLAHLATLPDPLAERSAETRLPSGLRVHQRRVPIGLLGVIYESRPNVSIDVAALAVKTGNAAILRGGKESLNSNRALLACVASALDAAGLPDGAIRFIDRSERELLLELVALDGIVDLIIPRGGAGLHAWCRQHSRIPVITGGIGICHLYVDRSADLARVPALVHNAKVQRPTVCNALDTLLVHQDIAADLLPQLLPLLRQSGVVFPCAPRALALLEALGLGGEHAWPAGPEDFDTEWLGLTLGLKLVDDAEQAMAHIEAHSSGHSDGILSADAELAERFLSRIDSAAVYWNVSTRFTDGGQLGLGAEVAVSTQRLHARGPMGLRELTTYKWVGIGDYLVRQ